MIFDCMRHYGKVIVLDFSTMWCGYCQVLAGETQDMQDKYGPEGFVYVTVLFENMRGKPTTGKAICKCGLRHLE